MPPPARVNQKPRPNPQPTVRTGNITEKNAKIQAEVLEATNKYRAKHGCPPLKINNDINSFAKDWAEKLAQSGKMVHRSNNKYGENIFYATGMEIDGVRPVQMWYDEIKDYDFKQAQFNLKTGHFTQLIWKTTQEVGTGISRKGDKVFVVCNYNPPGNVKGQFKENVPPQQS